MRAVSRRRRGNYSMPPERGNPRSVDSLAAETERGSDSSANLPKRLERYARAKERALAMRDFIAGLGRVVDEDGVLHDITDEVSAREHERLEHELRECGSYLVFRHYFESERMRLHGMRSCRLHLLCPFCAIRRGAKMLNRYLERVELVRGERAELVPHMLTLTVRDGPDLHERYEHLHKSVKRFHKRRFVGRGSEAEKMLGGVWSYEFKRGSGSGLWHPHMHAVWLCDPAFPPAPGALAAEWKHITGDSFIVETHPLYGELVEAFAEVFKYAIKFGDLPLADNWDGYKVLKRRRLIGSAGLLWGVEVPEDLTDDGIEHELFEEWFYRFARGAGYLRVGNIEEAAA